MSAKKKKGRSVTPTVRLIDKVSLAAAERDTEGMIEFRQLAEPVLDLLAHSGAALDAEAMAFRYVDVLHALCLTALSGDDLALARMHAVALDVIEEAEEAFGAVSLNRRPERRKARLDDLMIEMAEPLGKLPVSEPASLAHAWAAMIRQAFRGYSSDQMPPAAQEEIVRNALQTTRVTNAGKLAAIAVSALIGTPVLFPTKGKVAQSRQRAKHRARDLKDAADAVEPLLCEELAALIKSETPPEEIARRSAAFLGRHVLHGRYDRRGLGDESERAVLAAQQGAGPTPSARARAAIEAVLQLCLSRASSKVVTRAKT